MALIVGVWLVACATNKPHTGIVGRWAEVGTGTAGLFQEDSTFVLQNEGGQVTGVYRLLAPGKLRVQMIGMGGMPLRAYDYDVVISGDRMTWIDADGTKSEYRRMR